MGEDNRHGMTTKLPALSDVWIRTSCCPGQMRIGKYSCHFVLGSKVFSSPYLQCLRHLYLAVSFQVHIQEWCITAVCLLCSTQPAPFLQEVGNGIEELQHHKHAMDKIPLLVSMEKIPTQMTQLLMQVFDWQ